MVKQRTNKRPTSTSSLISETMSVCLSVEIGSIEVQDYTFVCEDRNANIGIFKAECSEITAIRNFFSKAKKSRNLLSLASAIHPSES